MTKRYVSVHRKLMIGKDIKFRDGYFETDDPKLQAMIEGNNAFGIGIHQEDPAAQDEAKVRAEVREREEGRAAALARQESGPATGKNRYGELAPVEPERTRQPWGAS